MAAPDSTAPKDDYRPAVYVDDEKVDSEKGKPWHLAAQDPALYAKVKAGAVVPVTAAAFQAAQKTSK